MFSRGAPPACLRVLITPLPPRTCLSFNYSHPESVKCYLVVVSVCISPKKFSSTDIPDVCLYGPLDC